MTIVPFFTLILVGQFVATAEVTCANRTSTGTHDPIQLVSKDVVNNLTSYGKLEGHIHDGEWGTVCAHSEGSFTNSEVDIACYQLGFSGSPQTGNNSWEYCENSEIANCETKDYWIQTTVKCDGTEEYLAECKCDKQQIPCPVDHSKDIVIKCAEHLQIALWYFTQISDIGMVAHFYNNTWSLLCVDEIIYSPTVLNNTGQVICNQLGLGDVNTTGLRPIDPYQPDYLLTDVKCNGNETALRLCTKTKWTLTPRCSTGKGIFVDCLGPKPGNLAVISITSTSITISWKVPLQLQYYIGAVTNYIVHWSDGTRNERVYVSTASVTPNAAILNLAPDRSYTFTVAAYFGKVTGPWSNTITGKTAASAEVIGLSIGIVIFTIIGFLIGILVGKKCCKGKKTCFTGYTSIQG